METTIYIKQLKLFGHHGVSKQERMIGNEFFVDVEIKYPFIKACLTDSVTDTINYAEVIEIIREVNRTPSSLLEHFAWRIREALCKTFPSISSGKITVAKPFPPIPGTETDRVAISIEW